MALSKLLASVASQPLAILLHITSGVGITGELPTQQGQAQGEDAPSTATTAEACSHSQAGPSSSSNEQDPTERLAVALGLDVALLAHKSGHVPGAPDGALHRLR